MNSSRCCHRSIPFWTIVGGLCLLLLQTAQAQWPEYSGPFPLTPAVSGPHVALFATPVDLDGDGDYDFLSLEQGGEVCWYERHVNPNSTVDYIRGLIGTPANDVQKFLTGDIDQDGDLDIVIGTNQGTRWLQNTTSVGGISFEDRAPLPGVPDYFITTVIADFNGDGVADLAGFYHLTDYQLGVCFGSATGEFTPSGSGPAFSSLASRHIAADMDNDGDLDLVVSCNDSNRGLYVIENTNGSGSFSLAYSYEGSRIYGASVADVNGDGCPDLLSSGREYSSRAEFTFLHRSVNSPFQYAAPVEISPNRAFRVIEPRDLDGDGDLDLALSDATDCYGLMVSWNEGGSFGTPEYLVTDIYECRSLCFRDLNYDRIDDFVTACQEGLQVYIRSANAPVSYLRVEISEVIQPIAAVYFDDIDGDGDPDCISYARESCTIQYHLNRNSWSLLEDPILIKQGIDVIDYIDVNGDRQGDFLAQDIYTKDLILLEQLAGEVGFPQESIMLNLDTSVDQVKMPDFNGDGLADLLLYSSGPDYRFFLQQDGEFVEADVPAAFEGLAMSKTLFADLDGDHDDDLVYSIISTGYPEFSGVCWKENLDGGSQFSETRILRSRGCPVPVLQVADFDDNGKEDVLVLSFYYGLDPYGDPFSCADYSVYSWQEESGDFDRYWIGGTYGMDPQWGVLLDLNGDSHLDLLVSERNYEAHPDGIAAFISTTSGSIAFSSYLETQIPEFCTAAGLDLDGDGDNDLVIVADGGAGNVTWYRNETILDLPEAPHRSPQSLSMSAFPNPFNPSTVIHFSAARSQNLSLKVYNLSGQLVQTLAEGRFLAGEHHVYFDGSAQSSGIYLVQLLGEEASETQRLLLLK